MSVYPNNLSLSITEEQAMLLDSATSFCRDHGDISTVRALINSDSGFEHDTWQQIAALGWTGIATPEPYGGAGLGPGSAIPIIEAMGKQLLSTPFISSLLASQLILRAGSQLQQERYLPELASGTIATLALLENEDWGDQKPSLMARICDDQVVLKGHKQHVIDALDARYCIVSAMFEDNNAQFIIVPSSVLVSQEIKREILIDETKRAATIDFKDIRVPVENILSGNYQSLVRDIQLLAALFYAAEAVGSTASCLKLTVDYLNTRQQFGKLIGSYQALKHPCVDILCALESSRSLIYHAATLIGNSPLDNDCEIACRMAKSKASETIKFASDRAIQFHGAIGFTYECNAQLYIRRAQWINQVYGDPVHHRKRLAPLLLESFSNSPQ